MQRTLFLIPHQIAGIPVFGVGWMLILVAIALGVRLWFARRRGQSMQAVLAAEGMVWAVFAAAIVFILPIVELKNLDGDPIGMAIRGYGVMLVIAVGSAVGLAAYRAKRRGIDPDHIYALAPWTFIGGIVGARLFYVIQYRDQFTGETFAETAGNMLRFTEGGLVVYGSFIGGFLAVLTFVARHRLSMLTFGDVIIPCLFLGVFFGRIGCLLNGCCYGGRCEDSWAAVRFPAGSPVYQEQLRSGELLGMPFDRDTRRIDEVRQGSLADQAGVNAGSRLETLGDDLASLETAPRDLPRDEVRMGVVATIDGDRYRWTANELPETALPVYAAQILSSFSALALCLVLLGLSVFKFRDGTLMMVGFAGYAMVRFGLEVVRVDEAGQFGTSLSISQWVSVVVFVLSIVGVVWIYVGPNRSSLSAVPAQGG